MATVKRGVGTRVARDVSQGSALDTAAAKVAARGRRIAAAHASVEDDPLSIAGSVHVETTPGPAGVMDRMVIFEHPAILSIEYGHVAAPGGGRHGPGRWVPGLHIVGRTIWG